MPDIAVLSDTHGLLRDDVISILNRCDAILHAGDFGSAQILARLKTIAPLYAVRGNNDKEWAARLARTLSFELFGIRFYMIHNRQDLPEPAKDRQIVICGHTHNYEQIEKNGQTWLNSGSCGPKRFSLPVTMAVIETAGCGAFTITRIDLAAHAARLDSRIDPAADASIPARQTGFPVLWNGQSMKKIILRVIKETDKGKPVAAIAKSCRISEPLAEQICRLYLTHPGVTADGIMAKMGL